MAVNVITLHIDRWFVETLSAENVRVNFTLHNQGLQLTARADSLKLNDPIGLIFQVEVKCEHVQLNGGQWQCKQGTLAFTHTKLGQKKLAFSLWATPARQHYRIVFRDVKFAKALFSGQFEIKRQQWQLSVSSQQLTLRNIQSALQTYLTSGQKRQLKAWDFGGQIALKAHLAGEGRIFQYVTLEMAAKDINTEDTTGQYVTEGVRLKFKLTAKQQEKDWHWTTMLELLQGQAYAEPVYLDFSQHPITLNARGTVTDSLHYQVSALHLQQGNILQLTGQLTGEQHHVTTVILNLEQSRAKAVYEIWIQPFVSGTVLDNLAVSGELAAKIKMDKSQYRITADLAHVSLQQAEELFRFQDLNGQVGWTSGLQPVDIALNWKSAKIYAIALGPSQLQARVKSSTLHLLRPWQLPVLDGQLDIDQLSLTMDREKPLRWHFSAQLQPISMEKLSMALGWPLLHGQLSGTIPDVRYQVHQITVGGTLHVNLFGGQTLIRDLKLTRPFGVLPQLQANIELKNIDLKTLTQTFDFGEITGKLDGKITHLRLSNWQPVQFDAVFATPEGDKSRHRISQRAVNNLSEIGGGAAGALQRSFLRFFEHFSYQKLGLSCQLRNEVCEMSGVGEAKQGYYIVKGGGFPPRIDVIGYTRRVNWPDLIARLKAVSHSTGPVVK